MYVCFKGGTVTSELHPLCIRLVFKTAKLVQPSYNTPPEIITPDVVTAHGLDDLGHGQTSSRNHCRNCRTAGTVTGFRNKTARRRAARGATLTTIAIIAS